MASDDYVRMLPGFWDGPTGIQLLERGGADTQRVAVYLFTNRLASNLGLYRLRLTMAQAELALSREEIRAALDVLAEIGFAYYDEATATVWVPKMAHYQFWLDRQPLSPNDKRVKGVRKRAAALPRSPFVAEFWAMYGEAFYLGDPPPGLLPPSPSGGATKGLDSPSEGAPKPVTESGSGTGTRTETGTAAQSQTRAGARGRSWSQSPDGMETADQRGADDGEAASDDRRAPRPADEVDRGPEAMETAASYLAYLAEACRHRGRDDLIKAVRGLEPVGRYTTGPRNLVFAASRRIRGVLKAAEEDGTLPTLIIMGQRDRRAG